MSKIGRPKVYKYDRKTISIIIAEDLVNFLDNLVHKKKQEGIKTSRNELIELAVAQLDKVLLEKLLSNINKLREEIQLVKDRNKELSKIAEKYIESLEKRAKNLVSEIYEDLPLEDEYLKQAIEQYKDTIINIFSKDEKIDNEKLEIWQRIIFNEVSNLAAKDGKIIKKESILKGMIKKELLNIISKSNKKKYKY